MKIVYYKEFSKYLNKDMEFKVYGHKGKPCLFFPSQNGKFYDYEDRGIISSLNNLIEEGKIQIFTVESNDNESFSAIYKNPRDRILSQEAYYNYIIEEIVPRIHEINSYNNYGMDNKILSYGVSLGAYHAMNVFIRKPDIFDSVVALSGVYNTNYYIQNYADEYTFLNSPIESLKHLSLDHPYINLYRRSKIIVCVGQGSWEEDCINDTRKIQGQFDRLQIPCWIDYWGYDIPHDWPSWLLQTPYFFSHILN